MNCEQFDGYDNRHTDPCPNPATTLLRVTHYADGSEEFYWACEEHSQHLPRHIERVAAAEEAASNV